MPQASLCCVGLGRPPALFYFAFHCVGFPNFVPVPVCDPGPCRASPSSCFFRMWSWSFSPESCPGQRTPRKGAGCPGQPRDRATVPTWGARGTLSCPPASGNGVGRAARRGPRKERPYELLLDELPAGTVLARRSLRGTRSASGQALSSRPSLPAAMARFLRLCTWLLALGPGLLATVRAECSQDCATCSYFLARPTDINPLVSVPRGG